MCGIVGIVSSNAGAYIERMTQTIAHRGPDDKGIYVEEGIALGHRRLSILDLSENGHQPMISDDGRYVLVFNGEIYNHWDIRNRLTGKYNFKSTSDTETILYGFAEYGTALFKELNGIFAFAIFDKVRKRLFIVRDQFGIKPLYYSFNNNTLLFGSEMKALCDCPQFDKTIDENALGNYLYFLWSPGEATPFKSCKKLLPGSYLVFDVDKSEQPRPVQYYELPFYGEYSGKSEEELTDELEAKLLTAVKRQLLSDVPVGFFLSGGLDSSLMVAMAKKINPASRLKCYTINTSISSSREGFSDDLPYAKKVAEYLDVELEVVDADIEITRDFDKMVYHLDEPQADAAPLNVANICKKAREQGFIVLLGGTAGDDLFSGYRRHQALYYYKKFYRIPYWIKNLLLRISETGSYSFAAARRLKKLFSVYRYADTKMQMASLYGWLPVKRVKRLFRSVVSSFKPNEFLINSLAAIPREQSPLNQMLFWDTKFFLTDHNLNYTDKMSMSHGIEVRVPFLDLELFAFSTTIPPELKMKGTTTKYILKKVAERYLPHDVIYRPKSGFGAPVRDWVINDLRSKIDTDLSVEAITKRGIFDPAAVRALIKENREGKIDASYSIWSLLAIESWLQQYVDAK